MPPSVSNGYNSADAGYGGGHVAFEAPSSNYLPTAYGPDGAYKNLGYYIHNEMVSLWQPFRVSFTSHYGVA